MAEQRGTRRAGAQRVRDGDALLEWDGATLVCTRGAAVVRRWRFQEPIRAACAASLARDGAAPERAVCVVLERTAHLFFARLGEAYVVPLPFRVAAAYAVACGLLLVEDAPSARVHYVRGVLDDPAPWKCVDAIRCAPDAPPTLHGAVRAFPSAAPGETVVYADAAHAFIVTASRHALRFYVYMCAAQPMAHDAAAPEPAAPKRLGGYAVGHRRTAENANAGADLVLAPESAQPSRWSLFGEDSAVRRRLSEWNEQYQESEHPFVERLRGVTNTVASWFEENETVQVVRAIKQLDPSFTLAQFSTDLREYVIPEVLDAFHTGQRQLLRQWCGDATYNVLMATIDPYLQRGYLPQGRTLDLSNVEVLQGKMLETGPMPVLVISFQTQELMYFTDPRTGEVKEGSIEQANLCRYAMVLTRVESELDNEITGGWKIVELARRGEAAFM